MFKVLRESPPIPETLSADGNDFLRCCFQRNPAQRPSASKLLEHPFVNSQPLDSPYRLPPSASSGSLAQVSYGGYCLFVPTYSDYSYNSCVVI